MRTLVIALAFVSGILGAQGPIEKTVGEFKELKAYDLIEVQLIKSIENKVSITGRNAKDVVIVNKNGVLKIRMNIEESFDGNKTKVTLYYTHVDILDANEGAYIYSDDPIEQFDLEVKAQEGGIVQAKVKTSILEVKATTGGSIELKGNSKKQKATLNTGGIYKAEHLITEQTEVSIMAAGEAYVNASKQVDAKIRVGGDVYVYGDPDIINENTALGGRVKRMN
ncbi:putative autotransporter adhesin-like protein [Flavobacteriaceae bacterium MAR_2010_72]|nr:putative autotransporter adhesin-like protein [Flavobacteriaceae bacterium MAR_2010_72]TVZ58315.1 putative autotransporter adhesin-like protein [Flavobacteriaceae bacterium MAR_2010_105]